MKKENNKPYSASITTRFLQICDEVVRDGQVNTKAEFAESVGEYHSNLAAMERGERRPTLDQIASACETFGYSPTWLILGSGPKLLKVTKQKKIDERVADLETEVARLKRLIKK